MLTFPASKAITSGQLSAFGQALSYNTGLRDDTEGAVTVSAGMVLNVAAITAGNGVSGGTWNTSAYVASTVTVTTADNTNPRVDLVVFVVASATCAVRAGTAAASTATTGPVPPAPTAGDVPLAAIFVGAGVASIVAGNITDQRSRLASYGIVGRNATEQTMTAAAAADLVTISGLSIPVFAAFTITGNYRKSAAAATAYLGLKLNATTIWEAAASTAIAQTAATNEVQDGTFSLTISPRRTNYLHGGAGYFNCSGATGSSVTATPLGPAAATIPVVPITSVIIRGLSNGAMTLGVQDVIVTVIS